MNRPILELQKTPYLQTHVYRGSQIAMLTHLIYNRLLLNQLNRKCIQPPTWLNILVSYPVTPLETGLLASAWAEKA